jgi:hypothetical protein
LLSGLFLLFWMVIVMVVVVGFVWFWSHGFCSSWFWISLLISISSSSIWFLSFWVSFEIFHSFFLIWIERIEQILFWWNFVDDIGAGNYDDGCCFCW